MEYLAATFVTGVGATALIDLWAIARKHLLGLPPPDYGLVGRWVGHMAHGQFRHTSIKAAAPVQRELAIGWVTHYLAGIVFAAALLISQGRDWMLRPTFGPALAVGLVTVALPFFVMQPGMGAGIAASRTPRPGMARLHSLITHGLFGVGLYAAGSAVSFFYSPGA